MREIIAYNGYLVYQDTKEKVVFYECDPVKNCECNKQMCRSLDDEGDGSFGFCAKTTNKAYMKDNGKMWYAVLKTPDNGELYWGREYIKEE